MGIRVKDTRKAKSAATAIPDRFWEAADECVAVALTRLKAAKTILGTSLGQDRAALLTRLQATREALGDVVSLLEGAMTNLASSSSYPARGDRPKFTHDCNKCVFLGSYKWSEEEATGYDLYFCLQGVPDSNWPTVIARYGNAGSEYLSGMTMAKSLSGKPEASRHPLVVAAKRAIERGYRTSEVQGPSAGSARSVVRGGRSHKTKGARGDD